ncbi:MAG: PSD1 domain-containing protein [Bryobacteraceae bacterium]|nr:PSD1 domain-containing protein [Bryobacteraceae bacterium]
MRNVWALAGGIISAGILLCGQTADLPAPASRKVDFRKDVEPIFKTRCIGCHGAKQQMSGLRLDARTPALAGGYSGPVIQPGRSADSILIHRVAGMKDLMAMPPGGKRLSADEIAILRAWIDQGANWPEAAAAAVKDAPVRSDHWAFQPIRRPEVPKPAGSAWVRNPIDAFILARLEKERIKPSPEAPKRPLLRRLSLDLTGLPPTPSEMSEFLADTRGDAYERQVDRLLASPHFGEKWARHWLDRARYADSDGYEKDWARPYAWRYRDWVIQAFNRDMPFDRFTIEQIAGDLLPGATVEQRIATGFHRNTLTNREGGIDNKQFQFENTADRSNTVATAWMALTTGCAQCHDHKYDPISQKEHYQLFAFFDNVEEVDIDAPLPGELGPYLARYPEYRAKREALLKEYNVPELQAEWERRMLEAAAAPGKWSDWDLAWDCLLKLTEGGDGEKIIRIPNEKRTQRQRDILTDHFIRNYHFAVGQARYKELKLKELDEKLRALKEAYPQLTQAMVIQESAEPHPTFLRVRGDYKALGIEVKPGGLAVLPPIIPSNGDRATRLDLARWLVSPKHPLTSRVAVNWIWQELFGKGIVRSSNDFGTRGDPPTHPELLDWLASEFMQRGWSVKRLIRTIVTSAAYRQSSNVRPDLREVDPDNRLLARQNRLRLHAELIRDSALAASGLLSTEIGGKSVYPPQPAGVAELGYGQKDSSGWKESTGRDRYRRGLYIFYKRSTPYPMLANFDAPKANVPACSRERSNTALQALNLLNDPVFFEAATALAYIVVSEEHSFADRLPLAFERTLGRPPEPREQERFAAFLQKQQGILEREGESAEIATARPPGVSAREMAAWVSLSSVLLNLDEFMTRE